jgi:hypothetical protein
VAAPDEFAEYSEERIHALIAAVIERRDELMDAATNTMLNCDNIIDQLLDELNRRNT